MSIAHAFCITIKKYKSFVFLCVIVLLLSCEAKQLQRTDFVLGTVCTVRFFEPVKQIIFDDIFSYLYELDDILNAHKDGSDIDTVNKNAGIKAVEVRPELIETLAAALYYAGLSTDGNGRAVFDPTIGPLVALWGIGGETERVPSNEEIQAALALVNWRDVEIAPEAGTVFLTKKNMALDLGAIAKGYAADKTVAIIKSHGIANAIIDLGGNIIASGEKPGGANYKIGVQDPRSERGEHIGYAEVKDKTLVTSGNYERFFEQDGIRYHHILSTETGYPVNKGLLSVTIIADSSVDADALSTTVYALGFQNGAALLDAIPGTGAIFIFHSGEIKLTNSAEAVFHLNNENN
jgi:thiamine biosynthesis lipoprotein